MPRLVWLLGGPLVLTAGCCCLGSSRPEAPPGTPVSLEVTVLGAHFGPPVDGFTLTLEHDGERKTHVARHGDTLTIPDVPSGAYAFYVHTADGRGGYLGQVSEGRWTQLEPPESAVAIGVSGGALLTGRVVDATTGAALDDVEVTVEAPSYGRYGLGPDAPATIGDASGVYRLGGLCGATARISVHRDGYTPTWIAAHRFPTDCAAVVPVTLDVALDPPPEATVTLDVVDGRPRFTRVAPNSVAARAGLRVGDVAASPPPEYDPRAPDSPPIPWFIRSVLDVEHGDGGTLDVIGEDGLRRTITVPPRRELAWPG